MHQLLHDYFWIYVVIIAIVFGALFYFMPKLTSFLEKVIVGGRMRDAKKSVIRKNERETTSVKEKSRYKSF